MVFSSVEQLYIDHLLSKTPQEMLKNAMERLKSKSAPSLSPPPSKSLSTPKGRKGSKPPPLPLPPPPSSSSSPPPPRTKVEYSRLVDEMTHIWFIRCRTVMKVPTPQDTDIPIKAREFLNILNGIYPDIDPTEYQFARRWLDRWKQRFNLGKPLIWEVGYFGDWQLAQSTYHSSLPSSKKKTRLNLFHFRFN